MHPAPQHMVTYRDLVSDILNLRAKGVQCEVEAMFLVLQLESRPHLWAPFTRFEDIIKKERFCTVSRWKAFKRAVEAIPRKDILSLGLAVSCLIAVQPRSQWFKLLTLARKYRRENELEPTYQLITKVIGKAEKKTSKGPSRADLLSRIASLEKTLIKKEAHIQKLRTVLRKNRISIPRG